VNVELKYRTRPEVSNNEFVSVSVSMKGKGVGFWVNFRKGPTTLETRELSQLLERECQRGRSKIAEP